MIFEERYEKVLKTANFFAENYKGAYCISNNIIEDIDVVVTGHFGNTVSVNMICDCICPFSLYNSTGNIGFILRALIDIFDKSDDNSISIKSLVNTPIRIVYDSESEWGSKAIAIGHFMKDRFILIEDLMKLKE